MRSIALIADIVDSRSLAAGQRQALQHDLEASLSRLNARREELSIRSSLTITLGDEFQGLFSSAEQLWYCVFEIERDLFPINLRFAIGVGDIVTEVKVDTALGMDGPAFHEARRGIETLRDERNRYGCFGLSGSERYLDDALLLISHQRRTWKQARLETLVDLLAGRSVNETAERIGTSRQAVYRNISDGALEPIVRLLQQASADMDEQLGASVNPAARAS